MEICKYCKQDILKNTTIYFKHDFMFCSFICREEFVYIPRKPKPIKIIYI